MNKTVGKFTITDDGLVGPAKYLDEQGEALFKKILAGEDMVFNMTSHLSPDVGTALLVRLQTDYAGWLGMQDLENMMARAK